MIFVTGASGLLGSQLLLDLALGGKKVLAIGTRNPDTNCLLYKFSAHRGLLNENIQWVEGDVLDISFLREIFKKEITEVYHCAGIVSYNKSDVQVMMKTNIVGTRNMINICLESKIEKLCYVSSVAAINRITEHEIIDENTSWKDAKKNSNYAISKFLAEQEVWKGISKGLKTVIVNPTIIIGPGNWKTGSSAMIQQVWNGMKFYSGGTAGFVDVRNVSQAMISLMQSDIHSQRFIINGENLSFKEVFTWIAEDLGKPKPRISANAFLLELAWRKEALKQVIFKARPFITKETTISGRKRVRFSNEKIKKAINIEFIPIRQSVRDTCAIFLEQNEKKQLTQAISKKKLIYGIQQVGIGVYDAYKAFEWYATNLAADVLIFDDNSAATLMAPFMGGISHEKRAIMALNLQGGGGYEFWQYLDKEPKAPETEIKLGDLGLNIIKIKTKNVEKCFEQFAKQHVHFRSGIQTMPDGKKSFFIEDPCHNILQIQECSSWYSDNKKITGGMCGCIIGVSDIDRSVKLYSHILEYHKIVYDETGVFEDIKRLPNGEGRFRRILLAHENNRKGGFSKLFGASEIELIQSLDASPKKIFHHRHWGDIGFIHLCFDVYNLDSLIDECRSNGFSCKVISADSFDMGEANGHWAYIEDTDGTLIEFVETHKVPLVKQFNWNINMRNRDPEKPLPDWLIKAMSFRRIKFGNKRKKEPDGA